MNGEGIAGWLGRWRKVGEEGCREPYPAELVFREEGVYEAPGGIEAGSRLHSGSYSLEEREMGPILLLQAANDAMLPFRVLTKEEDRFTLETASGCRIRYRRWDGGEGRERDRAS